MVYTSFSRSQEYSFLRNCIWRSPCKVQEVSDFRSLWDVWYVNIVFLLFITSYQLILSVCWHTSLDARSKQLQQEVRSSSFFWILRTRFLSSRRSSCKPRFYIVFWFEGWLFVPFTLSKANDGMLRLSGKIWPVLPLCCNSNWNPSGLLPHPNISS